MTKVKRAGIIGFIVALLLCVVFMGLGLWWAQLYPDPSMVRLRQMEVEGAHPFRAPQLNGEVFDLNSLKGTVTVVNFWATWCAPCVEEFETILPFLDRFAGKVKIVALSVDESKEDVTTFLKAFGAFHEHLIVAMDVDKRIADLYGTTYLPESYILDADHLLVKKVSASENWMRESVLQFFEGL